MRGKFVTFDFVDMLHIKLSENESVNSPHTSDWCAYTNTSKTKQNKKQRTNTQCIWAQWLFCSWVQVEKMKRTEPTWKNRDSMGKNRDMKTQNRKNRICSVNQQNTADYLLNSEDKVISHQSKWCLHWLSLPPRNHSELRLYFSRCHFCSIQWLAERPLGEDETHFKKWDWLSKTVAKSTGVARDVLCQIFTQKWLVKSKRWIPSRREIMGIPAWKIKAGEDAS